MTWKFQGYDVDEEQPARSLAEIANRTGLARGYVEVPGCVSWQGIDSDIDPTKAFYLAGLWHIIYYRDEGGWVNRTTDGWPQELFNEHVSGGWAEYTADSGMSEFEGGGVRSSDEGKPDFTLLMVTDLSYDEQVLTRGAKRMAEGAKLYGRLNHEKMSDPDALARCKASLLRHTMQYLAGETDEDHLAAIQCNIVMISGIEKRVKDG